MIVNYAALFAKCAREYPHERLPRSIGYSWQIHKGVDDEERVLGSLTAKTQFDGAQPDSRGRVADAVGPDLREQRAYWAERRWQRNLRQIRTSRAR